MKKKRSGKTESILYTGAFRFPDGDAAAFRVFAVATLIESTGCKVSFAGWEEGQLGQHYLYEGHDCFPQAEFRVARVNPLFRLLGFIFRGWRTLSWIIGQKNFDAVIAYNPPFLFSLALIIVCKIKGIVAALDTTEWYESTHLPGGKMGLASIENWLRMHVAYRFFDHVIAISAFLESTYSAAANILRVPPLLSRAQNYCDRPAISNGVEILYAGDAGKKDRLLNFIKAIPGIARDLGIPVRLHVAGISEAALGAILDGAELESAARETIVFHGRVARQEVFDLYSRCHFSVLFRERARYALAGFATKAVESLVNGCPIITNAVGDLATVAEDGKNAIIISEKNLVGLSARFRIILEGDLYNGFVTNCRQSAESHFAPESYRSKMENFLSGF